MQNSLRSMNLHSLYRKLVVINDVKKVCTRWVYIMTAWWRTCGVCLSSKQRSLIIVLSKCSFDGVTNS